MKLPSNLVHQFAQTPRADIPRSSFNRSHGTKTTFDAGYLIPFYVDEALPGDTFTASLAAFGRLATPIVPFMDNVYLDFFFFSVPNRLLWTNWKKFNGEQANPADSTSYTIPQWAAPATTGWAVGQLGDYLGLPTGIPDITVSALPKRAMQLIWNEWFRDQNVDNSITVSLGDGPDTDDPVPFLRRKRHDYFTSALPWPQKGTAVNFLAGATAPVATTDAAFKLKGVTSATEDEFIVNAGAEWYMGPESAAGFVDMERLKFGSVTGLQANLGSSTTTLINSLRQSFQVQKLYERDARGGTRYTEIILAHFGVTSPDARQQRPEYLGGGSFSVVINPVPQTSNTPVSGTPQGNLSGFGTIACANQAGFTYSATEHCTLIGIVSGRADMNYQQGIPRMWSRSTRFDFYWPALSHIGEQSILNKEIYAVDPAGAGAAQNAATFAYQERYAEYRYKPSQITGQFRSTYVSTLDTWHLAQKFTALPVFNAAFLNENPPIDRVIAVPANPHFLLDTHMTLKCARPMPVYSVPGLVDHF